MLEKLGKEFMPRGNVQTRYGSLVKNLKKIEFATGIKETLAIYRIDLIRNKKKLNLNGI